MPGLIQGRLQGPPESPNCVTTEADPSDRVHYAAPLPFSGNPTTAIDRLEGLVLGMPRTAKVTRQGPYLHVTFTSALLGYVDDVEFLADVASSTIRFRSASRVGWGDLGANARRMREVRRVWGSISR